MEKLTEYNVDMIKFFWKERGNLERYCDFEKLEPLLKQCAPEILMAWYNYKASIKIMDSVIEQLKPPTHEK